MNDTTAMTGRGRRRSASTPAPEEAATLDDAAALRDAEFEAAAPGASAEGDIEDLEDDELGDRPGEEIDEPETPAQPSVDFNAGTLTGDFRDFLLSRLRHHQDQRPWTDRSEKEQREIIADAERHAQAAVQKCIELVTARGLPVIRGSLNSITVKDGIKAVIEVSKMAQQRHALMDAQGATVFILVADSEEFTGERPPVTINPDQSPLTL